MEAAKAHWEPQSHSLWNDISLSPCSAGWQSELSTQNVLWWVRQELLISFKSPVPPGQVDFWGGGLINHVSRNQSLSSPLGITAACSHSHWARLLPDVTQCFPIDYKQLFPNRFPRKPTSTPKLPQVQCLAGKVLLPVALWPPQWLHPIFQWIPGKLHTFTPGPEQKFRYSVTL